MEAMHRLSIIVVYLFWVHGAIVPIIGTMKKAISSPQYSDLIDWLKESRLTLGLSLRDLAERLDEPHSFVQKVETLERRLDVFEYVEYCNALGLDPKSGIDFFT